MLSAKDATIIYETVLSSPGMNDTVKVDLRIQRKNVLLLSKLIELGLTVKNGETASGLLRASGESHWEELKSVPQDMLRKAGLLEMNERLAALEGK